MKLEEVENQFFWNFPQIRSQEVEAAVRKVLSNKLPSSHENNWEKEGNYRCIRWTHTPFLEPDGNLKYIICTGSDITVAKQLEEKCRKAEVADRETAMLQEQKAVQNAVLERERAVQQRAVELETKVKERTAELFQANALLNTLLETAPVGFALFDPNQRYIRINTALAEINGVSASDHIGRTVLEILPRMSQEVVNDLQHVAHTGEPIRNREVIGETPSAIGEQRHWLASYYPVRDREHRSVGVGAMVVEITERKRAEAALHRLRNELEQRVQERTKELATTVEALHKEVVERQRAEQLARGQTEALIKSLTILAAEPVLDNFLGYVLKAIAEQLDNSSGGIWLYDETYNTTVLHINYESGDIQRGEQITRPGSIHNVIREWDIEYLQLLREERILIQDVQQLPDAPEYAPYHAHNQQQGIKMILVIPLFFGETFWAMSPYAVISDVNTSQKS